MAPTGSLAELHGPTPVEVLATVTTANAVASPVSARRAAFVHLEVLEGPTDALAVLGCVVLGDLVGLQLEGEGLAIDIVVRRAEIRFAGSRGPARPLARPVPEIVPLLSRARGAGTIWLREHLVLQGDRVRLRATVEGVTRPGLTPVRRLVARGDLASVILEL